MTRHLFELECAVCEGVSSAVRRLRDSSGQGTTEYAILVGVLASE